MGTTADWHPDPAGRHEHRWWDGQRWTEHVADAGQMHVDPLPDPFPTSAGDLTATGFGAGAAGTFNGGAAGPAGYGWGPTASGQPVAAVAIPGGHTNGLAVASMVLGIVWIYWIGSILAVIFGHIALKQCRENPAFYAGRGMAVAGLVLGYVGVGILALLLMFGLFAGFAAV